MLGLEEVLGGVLVLGGITAAHVSAGEALPQMDPGIAHLQAFLAALTTGRDRPNFSHVGTGRLRAGHKFTSNMFFDSVSD
jgi:hypothetical protein